MIIVAFLAVLAAVAWWVCSSPLRIGAAVLLGIGTHPAPSPWIVAAVATGFAAFAVAIVWRALAASHGGLIVATRGVA
jgi:hypothetical protein